MLLLHVVLGITGLLLDGTTKDRPWSYRARSLVIMIQTCTALLVCTGTFLGRHAFFRHFSVKMFSRFGAPPESVDKSFVERSKNFRE